MTGEAKLMSLITPPPPGVLRVDIGAGPLIEIYPDGRVLAPSVEAAGEAGRMFVREVRGAIEAVRAEERKRAAQIAEDGGFFGDRETGNWIAARIREQGEGR